MTYLDRLALATLAASAALIGLGWQIRRWEQGNAAICESGERP